MSRRINLLVHHLGTASDWADRIRRVDDLLRRTQEQSGEWEYGLVKEHGRTSYHPPHIRRIGRGEHLFVTTYGGDDSVEMSHTPSGSFRGIIRIPMASRRREHDQPDAERTIAHARRVLADTLAARVVEDDLSGIETWATGIAAIVRSLGADDVSVRLPCRFLPLEAHDQDERYRRLSPSVRRRIATACPKTVYVDADPLHEDRSDVPNVEIGHFSRMYFMREGHHDLDVDPVGTMRAMAHVMEAAGLASRDIAP